ncbi:MAG: LacI family DNA-binding transcriptional regulator [Armatimonadota bacterium]
MPEKKAPTLRDVALSAGVSPFTVSVVLNGSRSNTRVSDATRRRIQETAATLHYHPNAVARSLARRCTNTIGVFFGVVESVAALANPYASAILQGVVTRARKSGYDVLLYTEPWHGESRSAARFRDRRSDGVILVAPLTDTDIVSALAGIELPIVAISAAPEHTPAGVASVDVDNPLGIKLAVQHLWSLGHRRIAHLTGDANVASVRLRRDAFREEMMGHGAVLPDAFIVPGTYDGLAVEKSLRTLLSLPEPPSAIIAGNDNIAIAIMETARELGISVPQQLSVVGFDDISAASQVTPKLTTLRQPLQDIGESAADLLMAQLNNEQRETNLVLLPPELIVRESTAQPIRH